MNTQPHQNIRKIISIQVKIGTTMIVLTTLILAGFGGYQYVARQSREKARLDTFGENVVNELALNLAAPLWNFDEEQFEKVVVTALHDENMLAIMVHDMKQNLMLGKTKDRDGNIIDTEELPTIEMPPKTMEIFLQDQSIGSVDVYLTRRVIRQDLIRALREIGIIVIILDILLFMLLIVSVRILLIHPLTRLLHIATDMAEGNFRPAIEIRQRDEIGELAGAFQNMKDTLVQVVNRVQVAIAEVALSSQQLRDSATVMSQRGSEQAASTEEVSSAMEEMMANITQNAQNARQTEQIALQAAQDAKESGQAVTEAVGAMRRIAQTITVIEEIANRTHLLSMNASIEASKAQEYGKGFAVVASEVRTLASQTKDAAKEINALTHSTVDLAETANTRLNRLVPDIQHTAELIQEISAASQEQRTGAGQITQAMQQLDSATQGYAATAEEIAATAEELASQAEQVKSTVAFFQLPDVKQAAPDDWKALFETVQGIADKHAREQLLLAIGKVLKTPIEAGKGETLLKQNGVRQSPKGGSQPSNTAEGTHAETRLDLSEDVHQGDDLDQDFERF